MSGQSKNKNKDLLIFTALYFFIVCILAFVLLFLPKYYELQEQQKLITIQSEINRTISQANSKEELIEKLVMMQKENPIDFEVKKEDEIVYQSIVTDFDELIENMNTGIVSASGNYEYTTKFGIFKVNLIIYVNEPQIFFQQVLFVIFVIISILYILVCLILYFEHRNLLAPLNGLRYSIGNLRQYRFDKGQRSEVSLNTEYDALSKTLEDFSQDLHGKLKDIGIKYTNLELQLQEEKEQDDYRFQLINALVHELKTPLNLSGIYLNKIKEMTLDEEVLHEIAKIEQSNSRVLHDVNDILKSTTKRKDFTQVEAVDLVKEVKKMIILFRDSFQELNIAYNVELPSQLVVEINVIEFKQIIHNIFSNVISYISTEGNFNFEMYEENEIVYMNAYNDADTKMIDFNRVFELFYYRNIKFNETYSGSGVGMYTIKKMVENLDGKCQFIPVDEGVLLSIQFLVERSEADVSKKK